jgi:carboxypeptidase C (cathepsin A)
MGLQPEQRKNVTFGHYEAGHMMYVHAPSLTRLREDLGKFMDGALSR